jgi:YD repeat-containing protein
MPPASRVKDKALCPADSHGKPCCSHSVTGPAVSGSPNVFINGQPALRIGDPGVHSSCCGPNTWKCAEGSATVFINGLPAVRLGDGTTHCGGSGKMIEGSPNVLIGGPSIGGGGSLSPAPVDCPECDKQNLPGGISLPASSPHPVHALKGCKFLNEEPDFSFPGRIPLVWTRIYSSLNTHDGPLGPGWSLPYFLHLTINKPVQGPNDAPHCLINPQGRAIPFAALEPGEFTFQPSEGLLLNRNYDNDHTLEAGSVFFRFARSEGDHEQRLRLEKIEDRNGNAVLLEYDAQERLAKIGGQSGHLSLEYSEILPQRVSRVYGIFRHEDEEGIAPRMLAAYEYDTSGRLASIALADGEVRRAFTYHDSGPGAGLMASHTLPSGLRCDYEWGAFPDHPRVIRHGTNDGMTWASSYVFLPDGGETTVTDSLGHTRTWMWNEKYLPLRYTNATGESWELQWNGQNQPTQCLLPNSGKYLYGYDQSGMLKYVIDPAGARVSLLWHGRYPLLLRAVDAEGQSTHFQYDGKGNRLLTRHPDGGTARYTWDKAGRMTSVADALGAVTQYRYNRQDQLVEEKDAPGGITSMRYDSAGNLISLANPNGEEYRFTHDPEGRILSLSGKLCRVQARQAWPRDPPHGRWGRHQLQLQPRWPPPAA